MGQRLLCLLLSVLLCAGCLLLGLGGSAQAAGRATSIGLAEHGIMAHTDGWKYQYGGKGQYVGGTRVSDCAGLIYAFFTDLGLDGRFGNCSGQVGMCLFSGTVSECLPNIHGLIVTMPDYAAPSTGLYGHIGIYIGGGMVTDNADYTYNMRRLPIDAPGREWNAWHLMDNGVLYPSNGWYAIDGKMSHYASYEYEVDTVVDGIEINSEGFAVDSTGAYLPVNELLLSDEFVPASTVRDYMATRYSGWDNTYELIYGSSQEPGGPEDPAYNGTIIGTGVRMRASASTDSAVVTTLHKGDRVKVTGETQGEAITSGGQTTTLWYAVTTAGGQSGYICSLFVERRSSGTTPEPPSITSDGYMVSITAADEDAYIYYTTDGTEPTQDSTPYVGPDFTTGCTYKAIAVKDGAVSPVATATVLTDGALFTDFTYNDWFAPSLDKAVSLKLLNGVGNNRFDPKSNVQRGQFVVILANLDGVDLSAYDGVTVFSDISPNDYYARAVQWASERGIASGSGGQFNPKASITRQEMCIFISRYLGLQPGEGSAQFDDHASISSWARDAVYACRDAGIINGTGSNRFDPQGTALRAQACVVAVNCYNFSELPPPGQDIEPVAA